MDNLALDVTIKELRQLKRMSDELQKEITAAEDAIKAELTARETDEIITGEYKVTWKPIFSTRLDTKALKAEQPVVYDRYARQVETRRFTVQ